MECVSLSDSEVQKLLTRYGSPDEGESSVLKRVLDYAKVDLGCNLVVLEDSYICKDYRSEFSHLYSKVFEPFPSYATRLHFFKSSSTDPCNLRSNLGQAEYHGYCIIRPIRFGKVGRTILSPAVRDKERFFPICTATYHAHIEGKEFSVTGCPYIQQDSMLMCCSHASIWVCSRYMHGAFGFPEILPHQIAEAASKSFITGERTLPTEGLSQYDVFNCFLALGYSPFMMNKPREEEYRDKSDFKKALEAWHPVRNIYRYIESGFPVLVLVPDHAIVAIGHTLSPSRWQGPLKDKLHETACMVFSDEWVDALIVHDDTGSPYSILPRDEEDEKVFQKDVPHLLPPERQRYRTAESDITGYIVPLPEKVYITAEHLDAIIKGILFDGPLALNLFLDTFQASTAGNEMAQRYIVSLNDNSNPLVLRTYASESKKYKSAIGKLVPDGIAPSLAQELMKMPMPYFIWVIEITTAADMVNNQSPKKILGQVIIDATGNKFAMPILAAHMPGNLYIRDYSKKTLSGPFEIKDDIPQTMLTRQQMIRP